MLLEEAKWIRQQLSAQSNERLFPLVNLGSSTGTFVTVEQPWIDQDVFQPLRSRGGKIINVDIKNKPGVDIVGDVTDPKIQEKLKQLHCRAVICSNILEHVRNRQGIAQALVDALPIGGLLIVSGPYKFPYHFDPIDTMFRPTVSEMALQFPGTKLLAGEIVTAGTLTDVARSSQGMFKRNMVGLLKRWYQPIAWYAAFSRITWMKRQFQATCVVLEKV